MKPPSITQSQPWRTLALVSLSLVVVPAAQSQETDKDQPVFELSPFEVDGSGNLGYYAANTLAGSRMKTNLADLASSITVVTLEQMDDSASVDINDVFRYEASTEGSSTYTQGTSTARNDGLLDTNAGGANGGTMVAQTHESANRIRGLGSPDTTLNFNKSIRNVPFDRYNIDSLEISRGPNSMLFGMGNPAGIVNQSTAFGTLGKDFTKVQLRFDDWGSARVSLIVNRSLLDDKLAVYLGLLRDDRSFVREPAYDDTERLYGAFTYRPFKKTRIRAMFEDYGNENRRPNSITPRDSVTEWRNGGMWTYNPYNGMLRSMSTGEEKGPVSLANSGPVFEQTRAYIQSRPDFNAALWDSKKERYNGVPIYGSAALTTPASVLFAPGMNNALGGTRPIFRIADGEVQDYIYWQTRSAGNYRLGYGTPTNPAGNAPQIISTAGGVSINDVYASPAATGAYFTSGFAMSGFYSAFGNGVASNLYRYPGVTDRSIYDWKHLNATEMNFGSQDNKTYNIELIQDILPDLVASVSYFRQDFEQLTSYEIGQLNVSTIRVDTNSHTPDGQPNPYLGLPFIDGPADPDQFQLETTNETSRAMVAWTPDFTKNDGWTRFLGSHQILGLVSNYRVLDSRWRKRWHIIDSDEGANNVVIFTKNPNPNADGTPTGYNLENRSVQRLWYLAAPGDPQDGSVTRSSGQWNNTSYEGQLQYFNFSNMAWQTQRYNTGYLDFSVHTDRRQQEVDSISYGMTSRFWNDRLITTVGWRRDDYKARATTTGVITDENGEQVAPAMTNQEKWVDGIFQTETVFNRWNRWDKLSGETTTIGGVIRPFDNRPRIKNEFLRSLGFSYNTSDNFNPPTAAEVDGFGNPLPKPAGEGRDYGIQFSLMQNRLFARINGYKVTQLERTSPTGLSRAILTVDESQFRNWAQTIARLNLGYVPGDSTSWVAVNTLPQAEQDRIDAATDAIWGLTKNYSANLPGNLRGTRTAEAKGWEVEVTYNPTRNWTMKLTASKSETVYTRATREFDEWMAFRGPAFDSARAVDHLATAQLQNTYGKGTFQDFNGREINIVNFWDSYGYTSQVTGSDPLVPNQQAYWDSVVESQIAFDRDLEGQVTPGQRRYMASFMTTYKFTSGRLDGWSLGGALRWEDKAIIGYYGRPNPNSTSTDLALSDVSRPIYDDANTRADLWIGYTHRLKEQGVVITTRLNVVNVFEGGRLQPVAVNYNGDVYGYRIIDPRQFILTVDLSY